ncbi:MAG: hypothetical protein PW792_11510 [Acidobacteriaceae bacterium]|nr:hypothetical protein [Acidobacteriaceae bacterium]
MLTPALIASTPSDQELFDHICKELESRIPQSVYESSAAFSKAIYQLPRGLQAMQSVYELDISMTLDDLAWHFLNHPADISSRRTYEGLLELELPAEASLFKQAWDIWAPHLEQYRQHGVGEQEPHDYLESIGVQKPINPLNDQLWKLLEKPNNLGLMQAWVNYARKYPERCIDSTDQESGCRSVIEPVNLSR